MRQKPRLPDQHPKGLAAKLVLAWLAYHIDRSNKSGDKAEHEASIRYVALQFRFPNKNTAENALKVLRQSASRRKGPWIQLATRSVGARGNRYRLGPLARPSETEWTALGRLLYGPAGLLTPYMARPILQRAGVGLSLNGCLVLATVDKYGPLTFDELRSLLAGFMDPRTLKRALDRSTSLDLIVHDEGELITPRNLTQRIRSIELAFGAEERARAFDRAIGLEQYAYQVQLQGGPTLARTKSMLKKERCFYCRTLPTPEGGAIEHFPPKKWGGSDRNSLLLPICVPCNTSHGGVLRNTPDVAAPDDVPEQILFPGSAHECQDMMLRLMMSNAAGYATALNERDVDRALQFAHSAFRPWLALKRGRSIVDSSSGAIGQVDHLSEVGLTLRELNPLGGIPNALRGKH